MAVQSWRKPSVSRSNEVQHAGLRNDMLGLIILVTESVTKCPSISWVPGDTYFKYKGIGGRLIDD